MCTIYILIIYLFDLLLQFVDIDSLIESDNDCLIRNQDHPHFLDPLSTKKTHELNYQNPWPMKGITKDKKEELKKTYYTHPENYDRLKPSVCNELIFKNVSKKLRNRC